MGKMPLVAAFALLASVAWAQTEVAESDDRAADEQAVRAAGEAYVAAFNRGDAKALASHWMPGAIYINRQTGERVQGRAAIAKQFEGLFAAQPSLKISVSVDELQLISPNVVAEQGVAMVQGDDRPTESITYTAVYIRHDGKWLLDRVTDKEVRQVAATGHLDALSWMIGDWVDEDEQIRIVSQCSWTSQKNFITRTFRVETQGEVEVSGLQIIGWDPANKRIRSWTFDSRGGFAEGAWTQKADRWYVQKQGTLPDGGRATAVNVLKVVDDESYTLQSVNRVVDGQMLPNVDEVRVVRQ